VSSWKWGCPMKARLVLAVAFLLCAAPLRGGSRSARGVRESASEINLYEAEILIYVMPDSAAVRAQHSDVDWERTLSRDINQRDYFFFWVLDTSVGHPYSSGTVGNYAVNKHTADVWGLDPTRLVSSTELRGVQKILRAEHDITAATIKKYRSARTGF